MPSSLSPIAEALAGVSVLNTEAIGSFNYFPDGSESGAVHNDPFAFDLDGDGLEEVLFAGAETQPNTPQYFSSIATQLFGWKNGTFQNITANWFPDGINVVDGVGEALTGDFNGDGLVDLFLTGYADMDHEVHPYVFYNQGEYFTRTQLGTVGGWQHGGDVGDIDGDGLDDVVIAGYLYDNYKLQVYLGASDGLIEYTHSWNASDVAVGDFDSITGSDVIFVDQGGSTNDSLLLNQVSFDPINAIVHFGIPTDGPRITGPQPDLGDVSHDVRVVATDLNDDSLDDVVIFSRESWNGSEWPVNSRIQILIQETAGEFVDRSSTLLSTFNPASMVSYAPRFADFDRDGDLDFYSDGVTFDGTDDSLLYLQRDDGLFELIGFSELSALNKGGGIASSIAFGPNDSAYLVTVKSGVWPTPASTAAVYLSELSFDREPDSTAPVQPIVSEFFDGTSLTRSGLAAFGGMSGLAEMSSVVTVQSTLNGTKTTVAAQDKSWSMDAADLGITTDTQDGVYSFQITATDWAGNISQALTKTLQINFRQDGSIVDAAITSGAVSRKKGDFVVGSDNSGSFLDLDGSGSLMVVGGQDSLVNRPFKGVYTSLSDSPILSPLTTLVHQIVDVGADSATAITQVIAGLGLSSSFSLDSGVAATELDSGDTNLGRDSLGKIAMVSVATQLGSGGDPMLGLQLYSKLATSVSAAADGGQIIDLTDMATLTSTFGAGDYALSETTIQTIQSAMLELNLLANDGASTLTDFSTKLSDLTASLANKSFGVLRFWNSDTGTWKLIPNKTISGQQNGSEVFETTTSALSSIDLAPQVAGNYSLFVDGVDTRSAVNISDAVSILKDIVGLTQLSGFAEKAADVNGDGQVNISDAVSTLKIIVGLEDAQAPVIFDHLGQSDIVLDGSSNYDLYAVILGDVDGSGVSLL